MERFCAGAVFKVQEEKAVRKQVLTMITILSLFVLLLGGCATKKEEVPEVIDYSEYIFTQNSWERTTEYDTETIHFDADGGYGYSCGCGNPVNDSDLCDGYTYDDETKTITLNCVEEVPGMITVIKVVACDGETLKLDFDGEIREFVKE